MKANSNVLIDQFGRIHDYLRISLTERCNLRCFYCMPEDGIILKEDNAYMSKDEILGIVNSFVDLGVRKIRLTGGEPLVRKDAASVIEALGELPIELAITTNGILVDRFVDVFKKAGVHSINVSLDTLQADKFNKLTRRNYFEKVMSNIDLLLTENFHVKLNAVLIRGMNDGEIIELIKFTQTKRVQYRFIEFMPFDGNKWDWSKGVSHAEILERVNDYFGDKVIRLEDKAHDTAKNFKIEGYAGTFALISSITNPFCDSCNRIRLTADGKIKNCLFSNSETDLLRPYRAKENLAELIVSTIRNKKQKRGGMSTFEEISDGNLNRQNRSMVSIGG